MITVIYGDDTSSSRNFFLEERKKTKNPLLFEGEKIQLSDLMQVSSGSSLFNEINDVFVENFISKKKSNPNFKEIVNFLNDNKNSLNVIFWEGFDLTKSDTLTFKNSNLKQFKIPQNLFLFLDNIKPNNPNSIKLFHDLIQTNAEELIFFMILRQFRLLLAVSDINGENIEEVKKLAPWQMSKLKTQAKMFTQQKLIETYAKLAEIDSAQKVGKLGKTLTQAIDFLLIDL